MATEIVVAIIGAAAVIVAAIIGFLARRSDDRQSSPKTSHDDLLEMARGICDRVNEIVVANQKVLSPIFSDPDVSFREVAKNLRNLYEQQEKRGEFGEWIGYLEHRLAKEKDPQAKAIISGLRIELLRLYDVFYKSSSYKVSADAPYGKLRLAVKLREYEDKYGAIHGEDAYALYREITIGTELYLNHIRNSVELIGKAVGELSAIK